MIFYSIEGIQSGGIPIHLNTEEVFYSIRPFNPQDLELNKPIPFYYTDLRGTMK